MSADPADSLVIAREFWRAGNVNEAINRGDYRKERQITNGGVIGLEAVAARRTACWRCPRSAKDQAQERSA